MVAHARRHDNDCEARQTVPMVPASVQRPLGHFKISYFFVLLLLFMMRTIPPIQSATASRAHWTGSRLNTTNYNKESALIEQAKVDYLQALQRPSHASRKELLCATFVFGGPKAASVFLANLHNSQVVCDWAVVVYDGDASLVCPSSPSSGLPGASGSYAGQAGRVVHCRLAPAALFLGLGMFNSTSQNHSSLRLTIPKTLLYQELAPYLPSYQRVLLLDEDISLKGFKTGAFLGIWSCAFGTERPLVVQAVVAENTQFLGYMNARAWRGKDVLASASGLIEQQAPAFDALFLEWFLTRVLPLPRESVRANGVDWGHDRTWCGAAQMYARLVLHYPSTPQVDGSIPYYSACAILPGVPPIHHLNMRSMRSKRTQRQRYRRGGRVVVQTYIDLFPTWTLLDISSGPDPRGKREYKKVLGAESECAAIV